MPPYPRGGRKEKFAQPKSGKLAGSWSCVALVVFMIVWWLDRLPVISCSNNAAFLTAEQIFLKAWKARAFSFTPTYFGEPHFVAFVIPYNADVHVDAAFQKICGSPWIRLVRSDGWNGFCARSSCLLFSGCFSWAVRLFLG